MCCILTCAALTLRAPQSNGVKGEGADCKVHRLGQVYECLCVRVFYCSARFGHSSNWIGRSAAQPVSGSKRIDMAPSGAWQGDSQRIAFAAEARAASDTAIEKLISRRNNQVKSNQVKSNQVKSNQIKSNQIKSNHVPLTRRQAPSWLPATSLSFHNSQNLIDL